MRYGGGGGSQPAGRLAVDGFEACVPNLTAQRQALGDRRALFQDATEPGIDPPRREIDEIVPIEVGIHNSGQGHKRQVKPIHRMGDQQGPSRRRFDCPEVIEFDYKTILFKQRRPNNLRAVMESMLHSKEFWSEGAFRSKMKSPLEMVASAVRAV